MAAKQIYLVRHCESEGNAVCRTQSEVDSLVTRKGVRQCEALRERLHDVDFKEVWASDIYRAWFTADMVAKDHGLPLRFSSLLREVPLGVWEDMAWGNIALEFPEAHRHWQKTPWDLIQPGSGAFLESGARLRYKLEQIARSLAPGEKALVVSHSCVIRGALCLLLGLPGEELKKVPHGENTSVSLLEWSEEGALTIRYLQDDSHLTPELCRQTRGMKSEDFHLAVYPAEEERQKDLEQLRETAEVPPLGEAFAVGILKGEPIGWIGLAAGDKAGTVESLWVRPELRGKGFGEQLLGYAIWRFRRLGLPKLVLKTAVPEERLSCLDRFLFETDADGQAALNLEIPRAAGPVIA